MKIIKWSQIEFVNPYSEIQADAIIKNIKDIDKDEYTDLYLNTRVPDRLIEYLQEEGCTITCKKYQNTIFLFHPKYIKGTYVIYTSPKTPFDD